MKIWKREDGDIITIFIMFKNTIRLLDFNRDGALCDTELLDLQCICCKHFTECDNLKFYRTMNTGKCADLDFSGKFAGGLISEYCEI